MAAVTGYNSLFDLEHKQDVRKVSASSDGQKVVNEGDTKLFKSSKDEMGKDSFLSLLVAQLKYQDPLNPAEDTQFVSQLAQFSQLEFTQNSTQAISTLASSMQAFMEMQTLQAQSITNASATPLLGKDVRVMEAGFEHKGLTSREFNIHLIEGNKNGTVVIKDKDGKTVAELEVSAESSKGGDVKVKWDGKDTETDKLVLSGLYTIEVMDPSGIKTAGYAYKDGTVSGVNFSSSGAGLTIDGMQYGLGYLVSVDDDTKKTGSASSNPDNKVSDDVLKKIASIMNSRENGNAIREIAKALGWREGTDGDPVDYEGVNDVIEILNKKGATEEEMIKKLAELLGKEDEEYAKMLGKVKNTLG